MNEPRSYVRRKQVTHLLAEYGPLTSSAISACLTPSIGPRNLRDVLKRLYDRGILASRLDRAGGNIRRFHQIAQSPRAYILVSEILGRSFTSLDQRHFRYAELNHSEDCAVWCELLRHLFPNSLVLRDFQLYGRSDAAAILMSKGEEFEFLPDILFSLPISGSDKKIYVAVEVERTVKKETRLLRKLRKYAEQTRVDGLIYICNQASLQEKLRSIYHSKVLCQARRIDHYGKNFFLFSDGTRSADPGLPLMFNAALENVSLPTWMRTLADTKNGGRSDAIFKVSTTSR